MIPDQQVRASQQIAEDLPPRRKLFGSLRTRLRWSYALASVIPLVLLGILLLNSSYRTQRQNIAAAQQTAADWVAREITNYLSTINDQLLKLGARVRPDQPSAETLEAIFALRGAMPEITDVSIMDRNGRERVHVSELQLFHEEDLLDRSGDALVQQVLTSGRVALGPVAGPGGVYSSYAPVFDNAGRVIGVIRAEVSVGRVERSLREAPLANGSYAYLVNDAGELQLTGDITRDQPASPGLAELFRAPAPVDEYLGGGGEPVIGAWASIPYQPANWKVVVEIPRRLAYQTVDRDLLFLLLEIAIVILTTIGWSLYQARLILRPIHELRAGAMTIGAGDLGSRIPIHAGDEIGELAQEFNRMAGHLERSRAQIERQNERLREGLALARDIQLGLLPKGLPGDTRHLVVHARSIPAYEVGGDFYTYIALDDSRMAISIGDISGKGVGAALMMALASSMVEAQGREIEQPQHLLSTLNQQLTARLKANHMNAAVLYAVLDLAERSLCVANAGMIAPLLLRDGQVQTLEAYGLPLGSMAGARYLEQTVDLLPGDLIVLVSDGIVEAHDTAGELFGFERLEQMLSRTHGILRPDQMVDCLMDDVVHFMEGTEQHDDMTVVVIQPNLQVIEERQAPYPLEEVMVS